MTAPAPAEAVALPALHPTGVELITAAELSVSPVELGIFDWVVDYADAAAAGRTSRRIRADHPLVRFGECFWMDMCRSVYEWRGETLPDVRRAVDLYFDYDRRHGRGLARTGVQFTPEMASLMRLLRDWLHLTRSESDPAGAVCLPDWPYASVELVREVQRTCERASVWAQTVGLPDLQLEAAGAVEALKRAA